MRNVAIILAAGFGTRMKEYTKNLPKPMLPFNEAPMIEYTIRQLKACGITDIGLNLHYLPEKITDHFKDGSQLGVKLTYVYEDAPSGTAGGVKRLSEFCHEARNIIVIYGDIITDLNYSALLRQHEETNAMATVCVHKRKKSNSIIEFNDELAITSFIERPDEETLKKYTSEFWVNSAIYCLKPEVLDLIRPQIVQDFPKDIFPLLIPEKHLFAYKLNANRYAIDSEEKYLEAQANFSQFNFAF